MTRIRTTLALLVATAVAGVGMVTKAISWPQGPAAGATVAIGSVIILLSAALALRMLIVIERGLAAARVPSRSHAD